MFKTTGPDYRKIKLEAQKLIGHGKYKEALDKLLELSRNTTDPEVLNSIGDLYIRFQNNELALKYLSEAYRLYKEQDFKDYAIPIAKKILRIDKERYDIYIDLVEMELENGNIDNALDWALEFVKLPNPDPAYLGKLFRLINELANSIQENTEQASKFERLFLKLQELAEQIALTTLETKIEFAKPQEFFDKGDFGAYGGFFGPEEGFDEASKPKPKTKEKVVEEPAEKIEFVEKDEEFLTSSGFAPFLGDEGEKITQETIPGPMETVVEEPLKGFEDLKTSEKVAFFEEEISETPITKRPVEKGESFKTVLEEPSKPLEEEGELAKSSGEKVTTPKEVFSKKPMEGIPPEIEEEKRIWETITSRKLTEKKPEVKPTSETKPSKGTEGFGIPQEIEEETKVWESVTSKKTEEKVSKDKVFKEEESFKTVLEEPVSLKEPISSEKGIGVQKVDKGPLTSGKEEQRVEETPITSKKVEAPTPKTVDREKLEKIQPTTKGKEPTFVPPSEREVSPKDTLLRIVRELKEDLYALKEWPYGNDPAIEVAKEYYEMKLYGPAIEEFQKLLSDHRYRIQAMIYLGKIFYEMGELEMAEAVLRKASEEVGYMDKEFVEVNYYLALTLESLKKYTEALELYTKVFIFDSKFLDVGEKVKVLRSKVS